MTELDADVMVVGSGIAGLSFALKMAAVGDVLLLTKKERAESNTNHARGGIAAVLGGDDAAELHMSDTFVAGAGLCHGWAVEALVREGPDRVRELASWGTAFDLGGGGKLALGREGGHSRRRIAHAGDRTGWAIETALLEAVAADSRIRVLEDHLAVDLLLADSIATDYPVCCGILALDHRADRLVRVRARATLLAAGGCGQVYRYTTNPSIATGDGIAMAYRAGARMANMEFIQFHPTALHPSGDPAFLISEALRGEGAVLRRIDGEPFMERYHPLGSLAPRDVVALAIDRELKASGDTHVVLDVSALPAQTIEVRFANTIEGCALAGSTRSLEVFRWCRRRTMCVAGSSPTATGPPPFLGCMQRERWRALASTAPTAWRLILSWRRLSSATVRLRRSRGVSRGRPLLWEGNGSQGPGRNPDRRRVPRPPMEQP